MDNGVNTTWVPTVTTDRLYMSSLSGCSSQGSTMYKKLFHQISSVCMLAGFKSKDEILIIQWSPQKPLIQ